MDTNDIKEEQKEQKPGGGDDRRGRGSHVAYRRLGGVVLVLIGGALILQRVEHIFPWWLFTWPMVIIAVGVVTGIRRGFSSGGPIILIGLGTIFLLQEIYPETHIEHFIWPIALITFGLAIIFGRHSRFGGYCGGPGRFRRHVRERMQEKWGDNWEQKWDEMRKNKDQWREWKRSRYQAGASSSAGEVLDVNAVFGSVKRMVLSKNFAGGEVNAVLGGCEVDLTKADVSGSVILEVNAVFGGVRLVVLPTWTVVSEMDSVFGSLEDKRPAHLLHPDPAKVLVLKGASVFGGTELSLG